MTATNHALTGALIGLIVGNPVIAVPAAVLSHFVCDVIPHYHNGLERDRLLKTNGFRDYLLVEASLCLLIVITLAIRQPQHWLLAAICAFLAASPDLLWINGYLKTRAGRTWKPNLFSRFAYRIQWFQRPIGWVVEAAWLVGCCTLLFQFLR